MTTLDKVDIRKKYNLPEEVKFCKKCVISNQRPRIKFDAEGVCNACRYAEQKDNVIDWKKREKELWDLLACLLYTSPSPRDA